MWYFFRQKHHFCIEIQYKNLPIITDLLAKSSFLKIPFRCTFPVFLGLKTKDEPKNAKSAKMLFVKIGLPEKVDFIPYNID